MLCTHMVKTPVLLYNMPPYPLNGPLASPRCRVWAYVLYRPSAGHCHFTRHSFFPWQDPVSQ